MEQVRRSECLAHCTLLLETGLRVLYVEAQAGQGKTTLVRQFAKESGCATVWYTCQAFDTDPVALLGGIIRSLHKVLPGLSEKSFLDAFSHRKCEANLIEQTLHSLRTHPAITNAPTLLMVFDDAQALLTSPASLAMVRDLVSHTPSQFRFVVVTRHPLMINGHPLFAPAQCLSLDNDLLAFKKEEVASLYNSVLKLPRSSEDVARLVAATGGWVAGLLLLQHDRPEDIPRFAEGGAARLDKYFDRLFQGVLPDETLKELALLALPSKLPFSLMEQAVSPATVAFVRQQVQCEFFMRLDDNDAAPVLRFHLLLRSYLRRKAQEKHSPDARAAMFRHSGEWWFSQGDLLAALEDYVRARDWERVEAILCEHGQSLLSRNQHRSLQRVLGEMPDDIVSQSGWLLYLKGASRDLPLQVAAARQELLRAIDIFDSTGDGRGTLLALANLLYFPFFFSIEHGMKRLLLRGMRLFEELRPGLDKLSAMHFAQAAAGATLYYLADFQLARQYIVIARNISAELEHSDTYLELVANEILLMGISGNLDVASELLDTTFVQANSPSVNETLRMNYKVVQAIILALSGFEANYRECKEVLYAQHASSLANSVLAGFLIFRDIEMLIARGEYLQAQTLALSALHDASRARHAHVTSQLMHFKALCMAHLGQEDAVLPEARRSLRARAKAEGRHFALINLSILGGALSLCPAHAALAERMLTRAIDTCSKRQSHNLLLTPLAYRAALRLRQGRKEEASDDMGRLLRGLESHARQHFLGWSPQVMGPVLQAAVAWGVETALARDHARNRMGIDILPDGSVVPRLTIETTRGVTLRVTGVAAPLVPPRLTPLQVRLLTVLATTRSLSLPLEQAWQCLWPGQDVDDVRAKFDTLLSRLRQTLAEAFGKKAARCYLVLRAGQLSLAHCSTDIADAAEEASRGLALAKSAHPWQAHLAFTRMAVALGGGTVDAGFLAPGGVLPEATLPLFINAASAWVAILRDCGRLSTGLTVVQQALELDPINDELQRLRYNLLVAFNRPGEAMNGLDEYRRHLEAYEFPSMEIDEVIAAIWT